MRKEFIVTLTFLYNSEEDISGWSVEVPFTHIETKEQAIEVAKAEIEANNIHDFEFNAEEY